MERYDAWGEPQAIPLLNGWLLLLFALVVVALGGLTAYGGPEETRAAVILLVLTGVVMYVFNRAARADEDGAFLYKILVASWFAKLGTLAFKWYLLFNVYRGADTLGYHAAGIEISQLIAAGGFPDISQVLGTESIELATGLLYVVTGPTLIGSWIVFALLGTLGMLLHYKAFVSAFPGSNHRLFAYLVFFYPSILMWTSTLGKDALMAFFLGAAAYGTAQMYQRGIKLAPALWLLVGAGGSFLVRPHLGALVAVALTGAVLIQPVRAGLLTPFIRLGTLAVVITLAVLVVRSSASFLGVEDLSVEGVTGFLEEQQEGASQEGGGSSFEGVAATSPQGVALAFVTVPFRPFPWEAHTPYALLAALEGAALLGLLLIRWRNVLGAFASARRHPYMAFALIFVLLFILFFSPVSNFGILVRQRVQMLPFLMILPAFVRPPRTRGSDDAGVDAWRAP